MGYTEVRFLDFRQALDSLSESYTHKLFYLTGARANELCGMGSLEHYWDERIIDKEKKIKEKLYVEGTRPLAPTKQDVDYDTFEGVEIMKIRLRVQKRKALNNDKPLRTVALPLSQEIEPWALDISRAIEKLGEKDLLVPMYRQQVNKLFRETGMYDAALSLKENERKNQIKNPLRHIRIHFLMDYYHMLPHEVVAMVGWEPKSSGIPGLSGMLTEYAYLNWTQYIGRLLKPLPKEIVATQ